MFLDIDVDEIDPCVAEARKALGLRGRVALIGIARSRALPDERQVYGLATDDRQYVMKYASDAQGMARLQREFATLDWLTRRTAGQPPLVVHPEYLSPSGRFHVTRFVEAPTATECVEGAETAEEVHQIMRIAGAWLSRLHGLGPEEEAPFWPGWFFKRVETLAQADTAADPARLDSYLRTLRAEGTELRRRPMPRWFSHGDLHGDNLLITEGGAIGLDLSEAKMKLPVYDISDIMRLDWRHDFTEDGLDVSGISRPAWEGFFEGYTRPVDGEVLRFCLKARLLIDWAAITRQAVVDSAAQRARFTRIEARLVAGFGA